MIYSLGHSKLQTLFMINSMFLLFARSHSKAYLFNPIPDQLSQSFSTVYYHVKFTEDGDDSTMSSNTKNEVSEQTRSNNYVQASASLSLQQHPKYFSDISYKSTLSYQ